MAEPTPPKASATAWDDYSTTLGWILAILGILAGLWLLTRNVLTFLLVLLVVLGAGNEREFAWAVVAGGLACSTLLGLLIYRLRAPLLAGKPNQAGPLRPE